MKNIAKLLASPQTHGLTLVLSGFLLPGCGTEIGNGKTPPKAPGVQGNASPDATTDQENEPAAESGSPGASTSALPYILEECASPVAELNTSRFTEQNQGEDLNVTVPSLGSWTLAVSDTTYNIQSNATASAPYAIKSSAENLSKDICVETTTTTVAAGVTRTTKFSDGYQTIWTLNNQSVVQTIKVLDDTGEVIGNWQRVP